MFIAFNSVVLSVALIVLMITFALQAQDAIIDDARDRVGGIDVFVSGVITPEYVQAVRETEGVAQAIPIHVDWFNVSPGIDSDIHLPVYTVGTEDSPISRRRYEYNVEILPGQAVISGVISDFLTVTVGGHVIIDGMELEVVEIVGTYAGVSNFYDFALIVIHFDDFSNIVNSQYSGYMAVEFVDPRNAIEMHQHLRQIDENMTITLLIDALDEVEEITFLQTFIYILVAIVVLACSFIIVSNFQMFTEGYKKQFSIMRTFGALGSQLGKMIFMQGTIIVGGGAIVGLLLALSLHNIVFGLMANVLSITVTIPMNYPLAFLVALIFSAVVLTALLIIVAKCNSILPLKALQEADSEYESKKFRLGLGYFLVGVSVVLFFTSVGASVHSSGRRGGGLAFMLFFLPGLLILLPTVIYFILQYKQKMLHKISNGMADIAVSNMKNNLTTTKNIVLSIMILFLIAIFGSTILRSVNATAIDYLESTHFLDITVSDRMMHDSQLGIQFVEELASVEGADNTVAFSRWNSYRLSNDIDSGFVDVALLSLESLYALGELHNYNTNYSESVAITSSFSEQQDIGVGDLLTFWHDPNMMYESTGQSLLMTESFTFRVGAVVEGFSFIHPTVDVCIDWNNHVLSPEGFIFEQAFIRTDNVERTISELHFLRGLYPEISWSTLADQIEWSNRMFIERFGMFILVLTLILVSISLGIINTVFGGIYRRRREYAVLRVIGTLQKTVAKTVYLQVFLYVLIGAVIGGGVGILLSYVLVVIVDGAVLTIDYITPLAVLGALSLALALAVRPKVRKLLREDILRQMND